MVKLLLVRPKAIQNESATGFLLRLLEANGFTSLHDLNLLASGVAEGDGLARVSSMLGGMSMKGLRGAITGFPHLKADDTGGLERQFWNGRRPRYCGACLANKPYWRAAWDVTLVTACPIHRAALLDSCCNCHKPLSWKRSHVATCDCGASLTGMPTVLASAGCIAISSYVSSMLEACPASEFFTLAPPFDHLGTQDLLTLCIFLGGYARNDTKKPTKIADLHEITVASAISQAAGEGLINWPSGYRNLLASLISKACSEAHSARLTKRFGYFYTALYKRFGHKQFDFLRREFESYIREEWPGQLADRNRRLSKSTRMGHKWVPLTAAAKQLGVKRSVVCSFIERGMLSGQLHATTAGRISGTVRRDTLDVLCAEKARWLTLSETREALHLSRKGAYALLASGKLRPVSGPTVDGRTVWRFSASDVAALDPEISGRSADSRNCAPVAQ
ncbi:TniQ family protein [Paraburkholderia sediminicola]|uniref:TniQ family protein n=1 Tax=Paraburkholderia sediminicola TaxID=458836 RepID=UPI0038BACA43